MIGAIKHNREEVINETADVMYRLFVLLHSLDIPFSEVEQVLAHRHQKEIILKASAKRFKNGKVV